MDLIIILRSGKLFMHGAKLSNIKYREVQKLIIQSFFIIKGMQMNFVFNFFFLNI